MIWTRPLIFKTFVIGLTAAFSVMIVWLSVKDRQPRGGTKNSPRISHRMANRDKNDTGLHRVTSATTYRGTSPATTGDADTFEIGGPADQVGYTIHTSAAKDIAIQGDGFDGLSVTDDTHSSANPTIRAIQLNDDVRLPAALMPLGQENWPPAVAAAAVEIGNTFYRKLQERAAVLQGTREDSNNGMEPTMVSNSPESAHLSQNTASPTDLQAPEIAEDFTLISNTQDAEQIRRQADEQFRALYGNEQFIRQTVNSGIEVRLPPEPASP